MFDRERRTRYSKGIIYVCIGDIFQGLVRRFFPSKGVEVPVFSDSKEAIKLNKKQLVHLENAVGMLFLDKQDPVRVDLEREIASLRGLLECRAIDREDFKNRVAAI